MRIEEIIECFNAHIEDRRKAFNIEDAKGHLVLQRFIRTLPSFKAYKECELILWYVDDEVKYKVLSVKKTIQMLESQGDSAVKELNMELCKSLYNLIGSSIYDKIIEGNIEGC